MLLNLSEASLDQIFSAATAVSALAHAFGSTTEISAIILCQVAVMAPIGIAILNSTSEPRRPVHSDSFSRRPPCG